MTDFQALRDFVLARLGSPEPLLPGEYYRGGTRSTDWAYRRWEGYLDEFDYEFTAEVHAEAVERFVADLEAKRERDYAAFHYGRDLLLDALPITVEQPPDPEPGLAPATSKVVLRSLDRIGFARLRQKVIAKLGRPGGTLPGEWHVWSDSPELWAMMSLRDRVEYEFELSERAIDDAIEAIAAVRERDRMAFEYGRAELLSLLMVELAVPKRDPAKRDPAKAASQIARA